MPFIATKVNRPISGETEKKLAQGLGRAIALLGKSESWLMLEFEENCRLYFRGESDRPMAYAEVKLLGKAGKDAYEKLTAEITRLLADELSIAPECVYVAYQELEHWGWNGSNL